jgi:O-antigen ligase
MSLFTGQGMQKGALSMKSAFFLLPFSLYLGVAAQSAGLYLFGLLLLMFAMVRLVRAGQCNVGQLVPLLKDFRAMGLALSGMWLVFPLSSILGSVVSVPDTVRSVMDASPVRLKLFASHLPSTVLVTGLLLIVGSMILGRLPLKELPSAGITPRQSHDQPLLALAQGSFVAAALVAPYFLFQTWTGFDFRMPGLHHDLGQMMPSGFFRLYGMYGHPLSMASVSLAQSVFHGFLALALLGSAQKDVDRIGGANLSGVSGSVARSERFLGQLWQNPAALSLGSFLLNAVFLFQSGGRTAAFVFLALIPILTLFALGRKILNGRVLFGGGALVLLLGLALFSSGLIDRAFQFLRSLDSASGHSESARFAFWKVHWQMFLDSPWFGIGHAQAMNPDIRDAYFQAAGFQDLPRKMNAHQFFVQTLADVGIFGSFVLAGLFFFLVLRLRKGLMDLPGALWFRGQPLLWVAWVLALVANGLHGLTQNTFYDASVTVIYLGWLALLLHVMVWPVQGRRNFGSDKA